MCKSDQANGGTLSCNFGSGPDDLTSRIASLSDSSGTLQSYAYQGTETPMTMIDGNGGWGSQTLQYTINYTYNGDDQRVTQTQSSGGPWAIIKTFWRCNSFAF